MWDETLIESKRHRTEKRRWITVTLSVGFHIIAVAFIIAASYWYLEAVEPQTPRSPLYVDAALPNDSIPVVIRRGTPQGNDRSAKPDHPVVSAPQTAEPSQDNLNPNTDPGLAETPVSIPFDPVNAGPDATGPRGVPDGTDGYGSDSSDGVGAPMIIHEGVELPVLVHRVQPDYPDVVRRARIEGLVVLRAVISRNGDVEVREVLQSVNPILEREAIKAVNQWKYRPARFNGRAVSVWFTVTVSFKLR